VKSPTDFPDSYVKYGQMPLQKDSVRILVVDDDPSFLQLSLRLLESLGYREVVSAQTSEDALEELARRPFDVVLLDIELGQGIDGIQFSETITESYGTPIIFLTAGAEEQIAPRINRSSTMGLLFKPINSTELDILISTTLRGRRAELALSGEKHSLIARIFDSMVEGVFILDAQRQFVYANDSLLRMLDYQRSELDGRFSNIIVSPRENVRHYARIWSALKSRGRWEGALSLRTRNGSDRNDWVSLTAVRQDGRLVNVVGLVLDATERKRHEEMLYFMAHHDPLTGLPNRKFFTDQLTRSLARARRTDHRVAVFFIDLDGFKEINDSLGHAAGDDTLKIVARRLRESLRKTDVIGRYGGDEFVVVIDDLKDYESSLKIADKLLLSLNADIQLRERKFRVGASIGISLYPLDGDSSDLLIQMADAAMYAAKRSGGFDYRFSDASVEKIAASWRRYRSESDRSARKRQLLFQLIRTIGSNRIFAVQPDLFPGEEPGGEDSMPSAVLDMPSVWSEAYWRLLVFLREEADDDWQTLLPGMRIHIRTAAAAVGGGEVLHELLDELHRRRARVILEMTERDLERLLNHNEPALQNLFRENIVFAIREATGVMIRINDYMRLPVDSFVLPSLDAASDSDQKMLMYMAQSNAHILGRRVLFDSVSEADFLRTVRGGGQDLYRGSLAGDLLSAADVVRLLKK